MKIYTILPGLTGDFVQIRVGRIDADVFQNGKASPKHRPIGENITQNISAKCSRF